MTSSRVIGIKLILQGTHRQGTPKPYDLLWDTVSGTSRLLVGEDEYREALGLVDINTEETLSGHSAVVQLKVGALGKKLINLIECQDRLRIELSDGDDGWAVAFDGFVVSAPASESSTPQGVSFSLTIQAVGVQVIFAQQWLNWQGLIRAGQSKELFGPGNSLYYELSAIGAQSHPTVILEKLVTGAVDQFIDLQAGDTVVRLGDFFQLGTGTNWETAFDLRLAFSRQWYLQSEGPLWGIMAGLAETDLHEFFWSYAPGGGDGPEIPTLIFRPRPFPGKAGDDAGWNALDVHVLGEPGDGTGCRQFMSAKNARGVSNVFTLSVASASNQGASDNAAKIRIGFFVDENSIKRFGYGARKITTSLINVEAGAFWGKVGKGIIERAAWQDSPLPRLWDQTRSYPLLAGIHAGRILEDHTQGREVCGYIVSVSNQIRSTNASVSYNTTLGLIRCINGVTSEEYPDAVRKLVNVKWESYIDPEPLKKAIVESGVSGGQSQPAVSGASWMKVLTKSDNHPNILNVPNAAQAQNLLRLQNSTVTSLQAFLGGADKMQINSTFRSEALNNAVGGVHTSEHLDGRAMDFKPLGQDVRSVWSQLSSGSVVQFNQLILEHHNSGDIIHISIPADGETPRMQAFEMNYQKGGAS